jgi:hypothetical protein
LAPPVTSATFPDKGLAIAMAGLYRLPLDEGPRGSIYTFVHRAS